MKYLKEANEYIESVRVPLKADIRKKIEEEMTALQELLSEVRKEEWGPEITSDVKTQVNEEIGVLADAVKNGVELKKTVPPKLTEQVELADTLIAFFKQKYEQVLANDPEIIAENNDG